jgi:hypothetical protein
VQDPAEQFYNPYLAIGNNPVVLYDPDGRFVPILVGLMAGAIVGAGSSAVVYTATSLASGNFNVNDLGKSVAFGAVAGAIGGGIGGAFAQSAFAQSMGFNILSNTASTVAGSAILNGNISASTIFGSIAGGVAGSFLPQFTGVKGGALSNIGAEISFSALKGSITGAVTGGVSAAVDRKDILDGIGHGAFNGAVGGAALAGVNISLMGPSYIPEQSYGNFGKYPPIYRKGTFITNALFGGGGVAIGRNLVTNELKKPHGIIENINEFNHSLRAHETGHYDQMIEMGFGNFYARTIKEYSRGHLDTYFTPGTLEYGADRYALRQLGYFYDIYGRRRTE